MEPRRFAGAAGRSLAELERMPAGVEGLIGEQESGGRPEPPFIFDRGRSPDDKLGVDGLVEV